MARYNQLPIVGDHPTFPYDPAGLHKLRTAGDEKAIKAAVLGGEWIKEISSGYFRSWNDLEFLRKNWKGPLLLKGIQSVEVSNYLSSNFSDSFGRRW
jgi:isopentenyl diphosphate isomerase/L-lactate dehydrogenase-like FMN-dependent dehydrogenase